MNTSFLQTRKLISFHSLKKLAIACAVASATGSCQVIPFDQGSGYRDARLGNYSPNVRSEYMARFQSLQQEIDYLKVELANSKSESQEKRNQLFRKHENKKKISEIKRLTELKVMEVRDEIDELISQLSSSSEDAPLIAITDSSSVDEYNAALPPGATPADTYPSNDTKQAVESDGMGMDLVDSKGSLAKQRNTVDVEIVEGNGQYDVVYVFDNEPPQDSMWVTLSELNIDDKWRGVNQKKQSYFIYVGVYNSLAYAQDRKLNLQGMTGQAPLIKSKSAETQLSYSQP